MGQLAVTCLGSGAALGGGRMWSSFLVDRTILLDLPPTAIPQLYRVGADIAAIDHVFISHFHADHSFGIPFFLLLYQFAVARDRPLYMIGPSGLGEHATALYKLAWPELAKHGFPAGLTLAFVEVAGDGKYSAGDFEFTAVRMEHFGLAAYGYRFTVDHRDFVYTGDTGECPQLHRLIAGADVVITEFTHAAPTDDPGHLDVRAVTRIATEASGTVLVTHMSEPPVPVPGVVLCRDGETYIV